MTTAFQADAFQTDLLAFQIDVDAVVLPPTQEPNGVGGGVKKRRKRKRRRFDDHTFDGLDFSGRLTPLVENDQGEAPERVPVATDTAPAKVIDYELSPIRTLQERTAALIEAARMRKLIDEEEDEDLLLLLSH